MSYITPEENKLKKERYYAKLALDVNRSLKYFHSMARKGAVKRNIPFNITVEDIVQLYQIQEGKCAISGMEMSLVHGSKTTQNATKLSVDRIDSSIGYQANNVQLVTWQVNASKSVWSTEQLVEMARAIVANHS